MAKYNKCFAMGLQKMMEYRADFFANLVSVVFPIIIQISIWSKVYSRSQQESLYGYSSKQMILYVIVVAVLGRFFSTGFEYEINVDIKEGGLNKYIVHPINYYWYRAFVFWGEKTSVVLPYMLSIFLVLIVSGSIGMIFSGIRFIAFIVAVCIALVICYSLYFCIGMLAFWISEVSRVFPAFSVILSLLSGGLFPLDVLGKGFATLKNYLPMNYMLQFPVDLLINKEMENSIGYSMAIGTVWAIVLILISQLLWNCGLKKYVSVGG
jgi:ABC-2 type transport system permease protein